MTHGLHLIFISQFSLEKMKKKDLRKNKVNWKKRNTVLSILWRISEQTTYMLYRKHILLFFHHQHIFVVYIFWPFEGCWGSLHAKIVLSYIYFHYLTSFVSVQSVVANSVKLFLFLYFLFMFFYGNDLTSFRH